MKTKFILSLLTLFIYAGFLNAQVSRFINYQAVARDNAGLVFQNQTITVRLTIRSGTAGGTQEYQESHNVTTNNFGTFSLKIGSSTSGVTGNYNNINWGDAARFLEVELIPPGGSTFIPMGTTELISVPHALYAETAGSSDQWNSNGNNLSNSNSGKVGIGTASPASKLDVLGGAWDLSTTEGDFRIGNNNYRLKFGVSTAGGGAGDARIYGSGGSNRIILGGGSTLNDVLTVDATNSRLGIRTITPGNDISLKQSSNANQDPNGIAVISATTPNYWKFHTSGTNLRFSYFDGTTITSPVYYIPGNPDWTFTSDSRLKNSIEPVESVLSKISTLKPVRYYYNNFKRVNGKIYGFLAQDVEKVFPEMVSKPDPETENYGISYSGFAVIAIKAIQEQQLQILELIKSNEELKTMIQKLQK